MQCACAVLHCHPGLVWVYHNLPHYLIKARFSEKQLTVTMHKKVGFDFLYIIFLKSFDVTTSIVSFLRGSNTQERDVTASPLPDVTSPQSTSDPTPEPHGRSSSRGPWPRRCHVNSLLQSARLKLLVFFILERVERYIIVNVHSYLCEVPVILVIL